MLVTSISFTQNLLSLPLALLYNPTCSQTERSMRTEIQERRISKFHSFPCFILWLKQCSSYKERRSRTEPFSWEGLNYFLMKNIGTEETRDSKDHLGLKNCFNTCSETIHQSNNIFTNQIWMNYNIVMSRSFYTVDGDSGMTRKRKCINPTNFSQVTLLR